MKFLSYLCATIAYTYAKEFRINNHCPFTVWPGLLGNTGKGNPESGGFQLDSMQTHSIQVENDWVGRVWGRTNCNPAGYCETGDCGNKIQCKGSTYLSSVSLAAFILNGSDGVQDTYYITLVDGYNIPLAIQPINGTYSKTGGGYYNCGNASCNAYLNTSCPPELSIRNRQGDTIACISACKKYNTDEYCCRGNHNTPQTCQPNDWPVDYPKIFKSECPDAFSYAFDDASSTFKCQGNPQTGYEITFCPLPFVPVNTRMSLVIIISIILISLTVLSVMVYFIYYYSLRYRNQPTLLIPPLTVILNQPDIENNVIINPTYDAVGYFEKSFKVLATVGSGGYGTVFKVQHIIDEQIYAIKRVQIWDFDDKDRADVLREVKSLARVQSNYVVLYYNSWPENSELFIQMEFCSQNLKDIFKVKAIMFGRQSAQQPMNCYEYYLSSEIFRELLNALRYLHECEPPIIHRDLKPDNILIAQNKFIKLGDFGLAVNHNRSSQAHTVNVGTPDYQAPEVAQKSSRYTPKVDIYSLGLIGLQLFDLSLNDNDQLEKYNNATYIDKIEYLFNLITLMLAPKPDQRYDSIQCLQLITNWSVPLNEIINNLNELQSTLTQLNEYDNKFFYEFLTIKTNENCLNN